MTVVQDTLEDQLGLDLAAARTELADARMALRIRDDLSNREAVVRCRAQADTLLDMYLALTPDVARAAAGPSGEAVDGGR
jgi:hypothetical protein